MTSQLTETPSTTENASTDLVAAARAIGESLRPGVAERDRTGELSVAAFDELRRSGLSAALVPHDLGGGGARHADVGAALRELARHDPSTAVAFAMHSHLVATQVWRHRHGADASAVLGKVANGAILISTGAADWVDSSGAATRVDGGYLVSGRKGPASGCEAGDVLVSSTRFEDRVLHFAAPFTAPGMRIEKTWDSLGLRASGSHTVVLEDVFVPDAAISVARPAGQWPVLLNTVLGAAMPLISAAYVGIADGAVDLVTRLLAGRSDEPTVQTVGEMWTAHLSADAALAAMFADAADLSFPNTDAVASRILARKSVLADAVIATVRLAIESAGGVGFSRACDLERLYRDVHGVHFHPLPRARQLRFTGRVALGHSPVG